MPLIASIDGPTRRIFLDISTVGTTINPIDIYKEMRALRSSNLELRKYDVFLSAFGNVAKGSGKFTERYVQENSGTRIIPYDASQELTITGTIITDDGQEGVACFDRTPLTSTTVVDINYIPPQVEIITVATGSGLSVAQDAQLFGLTRAVYIDTESLSIGDGSQSAPFNNLTTAVDYAESINCKTLIIYADIILDRKLKSFVIHGVGLPQINCNGQNLRYTEINHCKLKGVYSRELTVNDCVLIDGFLLNGEFKNCTITGNLFAADNSSIVMVNCISGIPGIGRPIISMNSTSTSKISICKYSGGLTIIDSNNILDEITVEISEGALTFDSSNTLGQMVARGNGKFIDNSNGAIVNNEMQAKINVDEPIEGTYSLAHVLRVIAAIASGEVSGLDTLNPVFMALDKSKPRVAAVTDNSGNRTSVTVDAN